MSVNDRYEAWLACPAMTDELLSELHSMDEETRANWRKSAIPRLNDALEQFAYAQLQLQKKMNDAQKWELGEILSLLKQ